MALGTRSSAKSKMASSLMLSERFYRVVEFYSGIGGMHFAIKGCEVHCQVVAAFEINTTANIVYRHNFPEINLLQRNIEGLSTKDLDVLAADIFLMSPPCQPFTRVGLQGDLNDPRTKSFLHIMDLISSMNKPPNYMLMENVKGFETSQTRDRFLTTLKKTGYDYQEFLISPNQFGIPNSRLRYYLLAKRRPHQFSFKTHEQILNFLPTFNQVMKCQHEQKPNSKYTRTLKSSDIAINNDIISDDKCQEHSQTSSNNSSQENTFGASYGQDLQYDDCKNNLQGDNDATSSIHGQSCNSTNIHQPMKPSVNNHSHREISPWVSNHDNQRTLKEFLEHENKEYFEQYLLPDKVLSKLALVLDIVRPDSTHSCCFTKATKSTLPSTRALFPVSVIQREQMSSEN